MAGKSSKSDLLQIVMMTLYLMAIFFGGWGAYNHYYLAAEERAYRTKQQAGLNRLKVVLKDPENQEALVQYLRVEESKKAGTDRLSAEVFEVLAEMGQKPEVESNRTQPSKGMGKGLTRHEFDISFKPVSLQGGLLNFVQQMEGKKPHVSFDKVTFSKRGKKSDEDKWTSDFTLVTYVSE